MAHYLIPEDAEKPSALPFACKFLAPATRSMHFGNTWFVTPSSRDPIETVCEVKVSWDTPPGLHRFILVGKMEGAGDNEILADIHVLRDPRYPDTPPDFELWMDHPSITLIQGEENSSNIGIRIMDPDSRPEKKIWVELDVSDKERELGTGISGWSEVADDVLFVDGVLKGRSPSLYIVSTRKTPPGVYTVTVTGKTYHQNGRVITHTIDVKVTVVHHNQNIVNRLEQYIVRLQDEAGNAQVLYGSGNRNSGLGWNGIDKSLKEAQKRLGAKTIYGDPNGVLWMAANRVGTVDAGVSRYIHSIGRFVYIIKGKVSRAEKLTPEDEEYIRLIDKSMEQWENDVGQYL